VLIVTYKNADLTRECLNSLRPEVVGHPYEVLLLDNNSGDGTAEMVAAEFPWIQLDPSRSNLGFAKANNVLAGKAGGEYLLLLNPDTIVHPGMIDGLLSLANAYPEAGFYAGRTMTPAGELDRRNVIGFMSLWSLFCFASGLSTRFKTSALFDPESLGRWERDSVRAVDIAAGCLLLIRSDVWHRLGGFDTEFWMYGEDIDLALRAVRSGYQTMFTPDATVTHVVGASSSPGGKTTLVLGCKVRLMRKHWSPLRAKIGIWLLTLGCGLRALTAGADTGWGESWQRRKEWTKTGLDAETHPA
jgi:GT2 family glycosyltransferase